LPESVAFCLATMDFAEQLAFAELREPDGSRISRPRVNLESLPHVKNGTRRRGATVRRI